MKALHKHWRAASLLLSLAFVPMMSWAQDGPPIMDGTNSDILGAPVAQSVLAENRGGYGITFNEQNLVADLKGNMAVNNVNGGNSITNGAFAGAHGVPTVIQNSGNNVIIQNATILNVSIY